MGLSHEGMPDKLNGKLVAGTDAKTTAVLSCLGLGLNCGKSAFLEKALWLDPRNTMAAHALIFRYTVADRPADVRRIATIMVETLQPNDPRRAEFARTLAAAK
jgi:hypothetical protein